MALRPSYFTSASFARSAASAGMDSLESTVSDTLTSEVETTSTGDAMPVEGFENGSQKSMRQQHAAARPHPRS